VTSAKLTLNKKENEMTDYIDGRKYMERIPADEPVFILRAQDKLASHFVRQWAVVAKR